MVIVRLARLLALKSLVFRFPARTSLVLAEKLTKHRTPVPQRVRYNGVLYRGKTFVLSTQRHLYSLRCWQSPAITCMCVLNSVPCWSYTPCLIFLLNRLLDPSPHQTNAQWQPVTAEKLSSQTFQVPNFLAICISTRPFTVCHSEF